LDLGKRSTWIRDIEKHEFEVAGRPVTVLCPPTPREGRYWAWKGEFLDAFPGTEIALLDKGFYIAYMSYPDHFGAPVVVEAWDEFYRVLTQDHGFAPKVALIGLSRGGLYCYTWAAANPEKVACLYGDAPVCDMRSWPGGRGNGPGSPEEWRKAIAAYGFSSEEEMLAYDKNPVDNLAPLADAGIPILHVYGEADEVVPWEENTGVVAERYRALGGDIQLIGKPGCKHHPHGLEDPAPVVEFIERNTAK